MKIGFIGGGNMATAVIYGLLRTGYKPEDIMVYDISSERLESFKKDFVSTASDSVELTKSCDVIVLAVKPQNYSEVLSEISCAANCSKTFVSIAAGITIDYVREKLFLKVPVVRVMPNTPLLLGKGATAISVSDNVSDDAFAVVKEMFQCSGIVEILPESLMNAIISVNGSSPAFVYLFAKAVCDGAQKQGIDKDRALRLFCSVLEGSAEMLRSSGDDVDTLISKVSSKGGTTIAALERFYAHGFEDIVYDAMCACTNRAEELCKEN